MVTGNHLPSQVQPHSEVVSPRDVSLTLAKGEEEFSQRPPTETSCEEISKSEDAQALKEQKHPSLGEEEEIEEDLASWNP